MKALTNTFTPRAVLCLMNKKKGFSVTDLMVAIVIMTILAAVTTPSLVGALPGYRLKAAGRDVASQMRKARRTAIKENRKVSIRFDLESERMLVDGAAFPASGTLAGYYGSGVSFGFGQATKSAAAAGGALPKTTITFQGKPRQVTFNSRGLSNPGTVYLENCRGDACSVVVNTAGRVQMRVWKKTTWH
jgi:Tfp pilus assembly protein FimT